MGNRLNVASKPIRSLAALLLAGVLAAACSAPPTPDPTAAPTATPTETPEEVVLVMGSWRTDDVEQMNRILDRFHSEHPDITIRFEPTNPPDYNEALQAQLASGTAPDLFYARSYATSRMQYEQGYLEPLDDLPGLKERFDPQMLSAWATDEGLPYAVPFIATSHGIYYNADIFARLDLSTPRTWGELMDAAQTIQDAGITPFANTAGAPWTIAELVFMNLAPSFIGGREGRMAYLNGERCFNDEHIVAAFQAVSDLAPFFPDNHEMLTYADSRELFAQGQAAMVMSGSWDIAFFEASGLDFAWSVFATPPPAGQSAHVTFHPDAGVALNAACQHKEQARTFLSWMTTSDCAEALANELPGFFPMQREPPTITNEHAQAFLALNEGRGTDARFAWEKLREGSPDGYVLMQDGAMAVLQGEKTPQEAADALQAGLAEWFEPAQTCEE
jgi:raffinose/stachyose/melibiose transport system substrate-binding protein